jgi:cytochrome c oxidase subunit 1
MYPLVTAASITLLAAGFVSRLRPYLSFSGLAILIFGLLAMAFEPIH